MRVRSGIRTPFSKCIELENEIRLVGSAPGTRQSQTIPAAAEAASGGDVETAATREQHALGTEEDDMDMPTCMVLERNFVEVLTSLGIKYDQRLQMMPKNRKWQIVKMFRAKRAMTPTFVAALQGMSSSQTLPDCGAEIAGVDGEQEVEAGEVNVDVLNNHGGKRPSLESVSITQAPVAKPPPNTPPYFLAILSRGLDGKAKAGDLGVTLNVMQDLRVCLLNEPPEWALSFVDQAGLSLLDRVTSKMVDVAQMSRDPKNWEIHLELLLCIRALLGNQDIVRTIIPTLLLKTNILSTLTQMIHPPPTPHVVVRDPKSSHTRAPSAFDRSVPLHNRIRTMECLTKTYTITSGLNIVYPPVDTAQVPSHPNLSSILLPPEITRRGDPRLHDEWSEPDATFAAWMADFDACAVELHRKWVGAEAKAKDVFTVLADGTYRWEKIVARKETNTSREREGVEFMIANMSFALEITKTTHHNSPQSRIQQRTQLERLGLKRILEKLKLCTHPGLGSIIREYNQLKSYDDMQAWRTF